MNVRTATVFAGLALLSLNKNVLCQINANQPTPHVPQQQARLPVIDAPPVIDWEAMRQVNTSDALSASGEICIQRLAWKEAQQDYQQALSLRPDSKIALYGLAKCSQATGDQAKAAAYYSRAVYSDNPADKGFRETNTSRLMEFALLLNKTGQMAESLFVYNHAASALDYQDSDPANLMPHLKVLLPEITLDSALSNQVQYTPEHLQALADTALAHEETSFGSNKEALAHMREAVALYPDSAVTYYYLGDVSLRANDPGAKAAYQKAAELGDDRTVAAAKERMTQCR